MSNLGPLALAALRRVSARMAEALDVYVPEAGALSIIPGHANEH